MKVNFQHFVYSVLSWRLHFVFQGQDELYSQLCWLDTVGRTAQHETFFMIHYFKRLQLSQTRTCLHDDNFM